MTETATPAASALAEFIAAAGRGGLQVGAPGPGWIAIEGWAESVHHRAAVAAYQSGYGSPPAGAAMLAFQRAVWWPVAYAGYCAFAGRALPQLADNVFVAFDSVCEVRLRDDDARLPAATDDDARLEAVLGEAGAMAAPIIDALVLRKEIAAANAWAVLLDAFSSAASAAATTTGEAQAVWARWRRLLELCPYPTKRRPRRFEYDSDGERLEVTVRASCCLFFTSESAKASPDPYCKLCYIESDANRVRRLRG